MALPRVLFVLGLLGSWASPSLARANPAVEACAGKAEGDGCGLMKLVKPADGGELQRTTVPGVCRPDECCDLDYSKGSPPETVCHACLACAEGPAGPGVTPGDSSSTPPGGEPPRTEDGPPAPAPTEKRGCSVGGDAPWLAAALPWLLLATARRRRDASRN